MNSKRYLMLAVATFPLLAVAPAPAEESAPSDPRVRSEAASDTPDSPQVGMRRSTRAVRNPGTGQIEFGPAVPIPVPGLSARERNMLSRSDEGLRARVLANSAVAVNLQGRFQSMATATADQDTGQLNTSCSIDDGARPGVKVGSESAE